MTKIKDIIGDWITGGWDTSYADDDPIIVPNPRSALLQDVTIKKDALSITFIDKDRTFHKSIVMDDPLLRAKIRDALSLATGKSLQDTGELRISSE
ncbi:MAG TPA: hypothetical protein VJ302_13575 [Blastocatellia bacterium]|nr:hypothetical protein [Blastocatellia bacterium]